MADYYVCTKDAPWTPEKGTPAQHPDAKEVDSSCDCCAAYICPNCGLHFKVELPQ